MSVKITFLGPQGTFCEEAALTWASALKNTTMVPLSSLEEVIASVEEGKSQYGVIPLENSREGSVGLALDLLAEAERVKIRGEAIIPVAHYLFAPPGIQPADLDEIHSHPQALAQCRPFLQKHFPEIREISQHSTAGAAAEVARLGGRRGALGPRRSGDIYGLDMLLPALSLADGNKTRFVLVGLEDMPPTGRDKTSLLFTVEAGPGRLYRVLALFAGETIDLCKIESRPTKKELGEYMFFLDFIGHRLDDRVADVLQGVGELTPFLKILGSYPAR